MSAAARALLAVALLLGALAFAPAGTACACSCAAVPAQQVLGRASAAVVGTPIAESVDGMTTRYTVRVAESYKQPVPQEITVATAGDGGACGIALGIGVQRIIVLSGPGGDPGGGVDVGDDEWSASLCDNLRVTVADVQRYAGPALPPLPFAAAEPQPRDDSTALRVGVALGAVALGAGAVLVTVRTIRRRG
ncbi:hypothetical protein GCM10009624_20070 [Gordonia sinesedis]